MRRHRGSTSDRALVQGDRQRFLAGRVDDEVVALQDEPLRTHVAGVPLDRQGRQLSEQEGRAGLRLVAAEGGGTEEVPPDVAGAEDGGIHEREVSAAGSRPALRELVGEEATDRAASDQQDPLIGEVLHAPQVPAEEVARVRAHADEAFHRRPDGLARHNLRQPYAPVVQELGLAEESGNDDAIAEEAVRGPDQDGRGRAGLRPR